MSLRFHPAAVVALLGAIAAAGSLLLQWYSFDASTIERFIHDNLAASGLTGTAFGSNEIRQSAELSAGFMDEFGLTDELVGYRLLKIRDIMLFGVAIAIGLGAAIKVLGGNVRLSTEKWAFLAAGIGVGLRPLTAYSQIPDSESIAQLGMNAEHLFTPGPGIYVAILAAVLLLGASLIAMLQPGGSTAKAFTPSPAHEPGVHVAQPALRDIHPEAAYAPVTPYQPGALVSDLTPAEQADLEAKQQAEGPPTRREGASVPPPGF